MKKVWLGLKRLIISIVVVALVLNSCNVGKLQAKAAGNYNATKAAEYALKHWNNYNSNYANFNPYGGDCANFVSQCLYAGGFPMTNGWYYYSSSNRTASWTGCTSLRSYLVGQGYQAITKPLASQVEVGDVIFYKWSNADGYYHTAICTEVINGKPWICAHNKDYHTSNWTLGAESWIVVKMNGTIGYDPQGVLDSVTSEKGTITVRGWAFDRDDLNAQLDIHVYVGGPAGSGAPCYGIKADKERKDVNEAYPGVGNDHGFDEKIKVSARGQTEVYVYAINNVKDQNNPLLGKKEVNITNEFSIDFESNSLSVKAGESDVMSFNFTGDGIGSMRYSIEDVDVCSAGWETTDWNQGTTSLIIRGKKAGTTNVTVLLLDSNKETLYQKSFKVSVSAVTGNISINPSNLILDTSNNMTGTIVLDLSACKNASQLYRSYTNGNIIEEAYEIDGTTVTFTYTAKCVGETQVVYTVVDKYGNELGKSTAEIVVQQLVTGIDLDKKYITLNKGDNYWLTGNITPSDASDAGVSWSSSNNSVATVDANGKVTAVGKGEATITAKAKDGSGVSASCEVTVKQPVISLNLNKTTLTLNKSDSYTLTATASPSDANNKAVTWTSSNTSVVTVDANGKVTAVGKGEATITAKAKDGSGLTATCEVTVNEVPQKVMVSSIKLNKTELSLEEADTFTLVATVSPSNAENKALTWSSANKAVAIVDANGVVTAVSTGDTTITAIAKDGSGVIAQCKVKVVQQTYHFADVLDSTWQYNVAKHAVMSGLMKGKGNSTDGLIIFDPNNNMTRAEFVQTLYNKEGKPAVNYVATFKDVPAGQWYTNAILWAAQNNIVAGKGEIFDVTGKITRQEMATILYKYATNFKGYETAGRTGFEGYVDANSISHWATENMRWALHYGIMKGQGTKLAPQANATRAECAAMLKNFMDIYE